MKTVKAFALLFTFFHVHGGKPERQTYHKDSKVKDDDADVFCKSKERLIGAERSDEIIVVDTAPGNSILMECKFCEERDNGLPKLWNRQQRIFTGDITEVEPNINNNLNLSHSFITKDHSLIIRNVQVADLALYFCKTPYENNLKNSFNYLIDFVERGNNEIKGTILGFKNYTQHFLRKIDGILSRKIFIEDNRAYLKIFTEWSDWSNCESYFRKEGIRYRKGKCKIKFFLRSSNKLNDIEAKYNYIYSLTFNYDQNADVYMIKKNIMNMGIALSCKSFWLRNLYPDVYVITSKVPEFVLSEKCKVLHKESSLKKGPRYRKSIILAAGAHLTLVCSDSTVDSQVQWVHDGVQLQPNNGTDYIAKTGEPRLYVDSFNTLYLFEVTSNESGNYTCFVDGIRMQEVNIIVLTRSLFFTKEFTRHLKYLGYLFLLCFFAYLVGLLITFIKVQSENRINKSQKK